jgi:hypothetical protein
MTDTTSLTDELKRLLHWSDPRAINTYRGPRHVRTAEPCGPFWSLWKSDKKALQDLGVSPKLLAAENRWIVNWYTEPTEPAKFSSEPSAVVTEALAAIAATDAKGRRWSGEQLAIFEWFRNGTGSLVVRARAGTGKTTTIKTAFTYAREDRMLYAVFNKKNQVEAAAAIEDPRVEIKTLHSVGFMFIQQVWPNAKPTDEVENYRVEKIVGEKTPQQVKTQVKKLVGFAKNTLVNPLPEEIVDLAEERDIECPQFEAPENGGWNRTRLAPGHGAVQGTRPGEPHQLQRHGVAACRVQLDPRLVRPGLCR